MFDSFDVHQHNYQCNGNLTVYDLSIICPKLRSLKFYRKYAQVFDERLTTILAGLTQQQALLDTINQNIEEIGIQLPVEVLFYYLGWN